MSELAAKPMTELKVTAHLMRLETGLFCIVQTPGARHEPDSAGLPGVRITLPPNAPAGVSIASFRADGWLSGPADAAVVRVTEPHAQLLVTIYQNIASTDAAPRLQVIRLGEESAAQNRQAAQVPVAPRTRPEVVAHQQVKGDVGSMLGEWIGDRGSKRWIEGFMIIPRDHLSPSEIEYQAVLGRGWLSPWSEGGSLCGSRGMSLPILGLRVRLKGPAAEKYDVTYEASFVDGSTAAATGAGEACEAESLSPLEAFRIAIDERPAARAAKPVPRAAAKAPIPAAASAPLPARAAAKAAPGRRGR
jgi:hypothetical protein